MKVEALHIELLTTIKVGMGDFFFKGQRFKRPFPKAIDKEFNMNPELFRVLDEGPPIQSNRMLSTPQFKTSVKPSIEPSEDELEVIKKRGEMAHEKAEETREMIKKMVEEEESKEEKKPSKKRRLPI